MNFSITFKIDTELVCGKILFEDKVVLVDFDDLESIINHKKSFSNYTPWENYLPFYMRNNTSVNLLEHIFSYNNTNIYYEFKNNNKYDLRRDNVKIFHEYNKIISKDYNVVSYQNGHFQDNGNSAYTMKNPLWIIKENNKDYILMYCETNTICKLCPISYKKILDFEKEFNDNKKLTFYINETDYILSHYKKSGIYIHQIITGCFGNGKGTKNISVDHIDQDPLNNSWENLRIANRKEQENNCKGIKKDTKRERKNSAQPLPDGITQDMLKKYVVYYKECYNKEKNLFREFFKIEKHPNLDKPWIGTKTNKISIKEKLKIANKIIDDLDNNKIPKKEDPILPKFYRINKIRDKYCLIYDKKNENGVRENLKMSLPDNYILSEQLNLFNNKINEKYN